MSHSAHQNQPKPELAPDKFAPFQTPLEPEAKKKTNPLLSSRVLYKVLEAVYREIFVNLLWKTCYRISGRKVEEIPKK